MMNNLTLIFIILYLILTITNSSLLYIVSTLIVLIASYIKNINYITCEVDIFKMGLFFFIFLSIGIFHCYLGSKEAINTFIVKKQNNVDNLKDGLIKYRVLSRNITKNSFNRGIILFLFILVRVISIGIIIYFVHYFLEDFFFREDKNFQKILIQIIIFLFITFISGDIIYLILELMYSKIPNYMSEIAKMRDLYSTLQGEERKKESMINKSFDSISIGKQIGILERLIIFLVITIFGSEKSITIIASVLAIKSLTRFKYLEIKIFSEYYFLGTILSYSFVLLPYIFFRDNN